MTTMNQSIKSPVAGVTDDEWISQLNLKQFEPIGSQSKKRMREAFEILHKSFETAPWNVNVVRYKKRMSLGRFDDATFWRILKALLARPEFCHAYNVSEQLVINVNYLCNVHIFYL
ncbi:hypothetical protein Ddc_14777 [Ditylenchus destructor]|nr:hypothetical protein Ddc_14777 [Ditylenchus destructor]